MMFRHITSALFWASLCCIDPCKATPTKRQSSLDNFIAKESPLARSNILANIGDQGSKANSAGLGIIIASPSTSNPDYFYTWTRDAGLVTKCLVDMFVSGDTGLQSTIEGYINAQVGIQNICSPSGCLNNGGLGEPKYNADSTAFTGSWGRPQHDGPALRVTAMVPYARWLVANGRKSDAQNVIWPLMQNDLAYIAENWNQTGFDLWEEVRGTSFFTTASQYRALIEGNAVASLLGKTCSGCSQTAPQVLCLLQNFWNGTNIVSNINQYNGRSGLDSNSILASIHIYDPAAKCDDTTFQPCSSRMLANHKAVTDTFRKAYALNGGLAAGTAVSVGRYTEDVYYNGNPWYLSTLAAAEQLYAALYQWNKTGSITIDRTSLPFWKDVYASAATGTYASSSSTYKSLVAAVKTYSDGYFSVVQKYTPSDGGLAEQFSRSNGSPLSAVDLTWSYAAFLTAAQRRATIEPPSWGQVSASNLPTACSATSIRGSYTAPSAMFSTKASTCSVQATQIAVTFNERKQTVSGQSVYIVGSIPALGSWDTTKAIPLSASKYTSSDPLWYATVNLPTKTSFEYKYIVKSTNGGLQWESDPNRRYTVPNGCNSNTATQNDTWR